MAQKRTRLPARLPANSKYVLEIRGRMKGMILIHRFVELPDGRRVELAARWTPTSDSETKIASLGRSSSSDSARLLPAQCV